MKAEIRLERVSLHRAFLDPLTSKATLIQPRLLRLRPRRSAEKRRARFGSCEQACSKGPARCAERADRSARAIRKRSERGIGGGDEALEQQISAACSRRARSDYPR